MHILMGLLGLFALGAALVLGMRAAERLTARWLGLPSFRWFEVKVGPAWGRKRFVVAHRETLDVSERQRV